MTYWQILRRSWTYYWQIHVAMVLAVALTTAVLCGALTVGDSMRGSLRQLTLDRLGDIEQVLLSQSFFDDQIVSDWKQTPLFQETYQDAAAALHFPNASLERTSDGTEPAASDSSAESLQNWTSVEVWSMTAAMQSWDWGTVEFPVPQSGEVVINRTAADAMGLRDQDIGGLLTVRLGKPSEVPTESFIATKDDSVTSLPRLQLKAIVPDEGWGRISLTPGTEVPGLVFLTPGQLQRAIPRATRDARSDADLYNTILVRGKQAGGYQPLPQVEQAWATLHLALADAGIKVKHVQLQYPADPTADSAEVESILNYYSVSSTRMLIDFGQQSVIEEALEGLPYQPVLTYLANRIQLVNQDSESGIPFSMVSALDDDQTFAFQDLEGKTLPPLKPGQIYLNQWAAKELNAQVGEKIRVTYYEPETVDGEEVEQQAEWELAGIVALTRPSQPFRNQGQEVLPSEFESPPTTANDPWLTPEVPGVTDAASIDRWDLPFETAVGPADDQYWQEYRTTPKAFLSMQDGQRLWKNRFGQYTSYRIPAEAVTLPQLQQRLSTAVDAKLSRVGFQSMAVKQLGLAGSSGSTPFDVLFLMFSMFVITASLMLSGLFFRLGMQQRSRELGLWLAIGFTEKQARKNWIAESLGSTLLGILLGSVLGIGYAWTIAYLMRTAWVGAVASPFLYLHWSWVSILGGAIASFLVSLLVVWWTVRQASHVSARALLSGGWNDGQTGSRSARWWHSFSVRVVLLVVALAASAGGFFAVGDTQAVVFLTGGFCALAVVVLTVYDRLLHRKTTGPFRLASVTQLNLSRQPLRSMIIISLVSLATFLIVAVSAFRLAPTERGTASFDYVATTDVGVLQELNSFVASEGESSIAFQGYGFRFHDGEHASCNNPFQARLPQVMGVDPRFINRFDNPEVPAFAWAGSVASDAKDKANPWHLLNLDLEDEKVIPVIMDKNTAWYSLKVYLPGSQFTVNFPDAGEVTFQLVGLLDNAVLQGTLLIGQDDYQKLFPRDAGKRYFLLQLTGDQAKGRSQVVRLGEELKNYGWQVKEADQVLANYMAVQNTYLSAFQSLGSLGLLLGTIGLIVAQYRSLLERRSEMALMQALGFPKSRIQKLVTSETTWLMVYGFVSGLLGALVCVLPHWLSGSATVPWLWLSGTLGIILVLGLMASLFLGWAMMQGRLVSLLRTE